MMKLTVEIKDEKIIYEYVVGSSRSAGESPICPDSLNAFNVMLKMCFAYHTHRYREWEDEIRGKAYLEKHPELLNKDLKAKNP